MTEAISQPRRGLWCRFRGILGAFAAGACLILPVSADASLILKDINETTDPGGSLEIDLNGDSTPDFLIDVFADAGGGYDSAQIIGLPQNPLVCKATPELCLEGQIADIVENYLYLAVRFVSGAVGVDDFTENESAWFYVYDADQGKNVGNWLEIGDLGFVGVRIPTKARDYNYGWIEIQRGSITALKTGYETEVNKAAGLSVPAPGSLPLLLGGLACIAAMRRRRQGTRATA